MKIFFISVHVRWFRRSKKNIFLHNPRLLIRHHNKLPLARGLLFLFHLLKITKATIYSLNLRLILNIYCLPLILFLVGNFKLFVLMILFSKQFNQFPLKNPLTEDRVLQFTPQDIQLTIICATQHLQQHLLGQVTGCRRV